MIHQYICRYCLPPPLLHQTWKVKTCEFFETYLYVVVFSFCCCCCCLLNILCVLVVRVGLIKNTGVFSFAAFCTFTFLSLSYVSSVFSGLPLLCLYLSLSVKFLVKYRFSVYLFIFSYKNLTFVSPLLFLRPLHVAVASHAIQTTPA